MQVAGDLPDRVPGALLGPLHVLRQRLQHVDEDLLHHGHSAHHLPHEVQGALLHHLRLARRPVPSLQGADPGGRRADLHLEHGVDALDLVLVLLDLARGDRLRPPDRHAPQDARRREPDQPLRRRARPLPLLLHSQLVSVRCSLTYEV